MKYLFSSESVTEGHPDKVADQISDAILDACLKEDKYSRTGVEAMVKSNTIYIIGEVTTKASVDFEKVARDTVKEIGYTEEDLGFCYKTADVIVNVTKQSPDIALGVDNSQEAKEGDEDKFTKTGAGDQGMMFGYATNETQSYMPLPITIAHRLCKVLSEKRKSGGMNFLKPDGKSQVTIEYEDNVPKRIHTVLVSAHHADDKDIEELRREIINEIIKPTLKAEFPKYIDNDIRYLVNPTGRFAVGGPVADSGLTGRKIIVDTYGGRARHGGGCFSGKDLTKVDRSGAYMGRFAAKNIVAAGLADICEIQVAFAIGVAEPVSIYLETFGTEKKSLKVIADYVKSNFDFRPAAIVHKLDLLRPIYKQTAAYGHFGRLDIDLPWEKII